MRVRRLFYPGPFDRGAPGRGTSTPAQDQATPAVFPGAQSPTPASRPLSPRHRPPHFSEGPVVPTSQIECPHCAAVIRVRLVARGGRVRCPYCNTAFAVLPRRSDPRLLIAVVALALLVL